MMLVAAIFLAGVLTPSVRQAVQDRLAGQEREILATAEGNVLNDSSNAKVIKVRDAEGLWVEVLKLDENGQSSMVDRVLLPDRHDGLFNFHGHVTRLAIADIDQDGQFELLAPSFDQQLVPHLNIFRYNAALGKFEPYQPAEN
ncbi:MAG: hypothetical protein AB7F86_03425 [Bdellovibrionales bacterium]